MWTSILKLDRFKTIYIVSIYLFIRESFLVLLQVRLCVKFIRNNGENCIFEDLKSRLCTQRAASVARALHSLAAGGLFYYYYGGTREIEIPQGAAD